MSNGAGHSTRRSAVWGALAGTLLVAAVLGILILFDIDEQVLGLLRWLEAQGGWAPLLFVLVMTAAVVLLLPGVPFTMGAGFVFGVVEGSVYVVLGTTLGAALAFLIARHLLGQRARRYLLSHPRLNLVDGELAHQGWKIVMLTRLVPFFPFKLSNYFFGLTSFSMRGFVGGTILGVVPLSVNSVYLGSIAGDIAKLGTRTVERTPLEWGLYGAGFLVAVGVLLYLKRVARKALAK